MIEKTPGVEEFGRYAAIMKRPVCLRKCEKHALQRFWRFFRVSLLEIKDKPVPFDLAGLRSGIRNRAPGQREEAGISAPSKRAASP